MSADGGVRPPVGGTTEPLKPRPGGDAAGLEYPPSPAAKPGLEAKWLHTPSCAHRVDGLGICNCGAGQFNALADRLIALRAAFETAANELDGDHLIFAARAATRIRQTLNEENQP